MLGSELLREELFPIREVARRTGVNPVTLRAWERRYGLIRPLRTESGHRLYSRADIENVRSVLQWIGRGVAVSKIGSVLSRTNASRALISSLGQDFAVKEWAQWQSMLSAALGKFDETQLERLYNEIFSRYPITVVFQDILMPLWQRILVRQKEFGRVSEWLLFDTFLRGRVCQRLQLKCSTPTWRVILVALPDQCRELELLVTGLLLGNSRTAISVLAIGQPLDELTLICEKTRPDALVLFSNRPPAADLPRRLSRLALAVECPVLLAGHIADLMQDGLGRSSLDCLGSDGGTMSRRLQQFLVGALDT
jgi:DNA-binding transcriptional MerR regulator